MPRSRLHREGRERGAGRLPPQPAGPRDAGPRTGCGGAGVGGGDERVERVAERGATCGAPPYGLEGDRRARGADRLLEGGGDVCEPGGAEQRFPREGSFSDGQERAPGQGLENRGQRIEWFAMKSCADLIYSV